VRGEGKPQLNFFKKIILKSSQELKKIQTLVERTMQGMAANLKIKSTLKKINN